MAIDELPFPFWILVYRGETPWRPVTLTPGLAAAFSNHTRAGEFLKTANNPEWETRLVVRVTLTALLEDFRLQGVLGISLDPDTDASGTSVMFEDTAA